MNTIEAVGWMIVSVLNEHFPHPDHPETWIDDDDPNDALIGTAGCIINCGPCGALHGLDASGRHAVEDFIRLTGYANSGWDWWQDDDGGLRWDVLEAYWAGHITCGVSNGVPTGCRFDDDAAQMPHAAAVANAEPLSAPGGSKRSQTPDAATGLTGGGKR